MKNALSSKSAILTCSIAALLATLPQIAHAAIVSTWANVGTTWATAANWGGTTPGTTDDALFNSASYTGFQPAFSANAALGEFHSSGTGAITFTGTSTLTLNANGSIAGTGILVDSTAGAVSFAGVKFSLGATQSWTNNSNNVVQANGTIALGANTLTLNGSGSGGFNLNGIISGAGGNLTMNESSGTLTLGGANSFTGNTTITAGTLIVGSTFAGKLGGNATTYAGTITNNGAFIYKTNTSQTYSGVISGSGSLTKDTSSTFDSSGLSMLTLSNASNNYFGATTITAGTLSVSASGNLGNAAANLVFNGGTLQITGAALTNFSGIGHTVLFTSGKTVGLDINSNATTFTVDQVLNQGTGGFIKAGAGTVILNQTNTYTGNTIVKAGVLQYASTSAISGSGRNVTINPGGAVQFAAFSNTDIATALGRIDTNSKGTIDPTNNLGGTFDFNSAGLANTSLGAGGSTGINVDFTGALTPFGTTYRLGGTNSITNTIRMATANQLSGANDVVVTGGVAYIANQGYSGTTTINFGTLTVGNGTTGSLNGTTGGALTFGGTGTFNVNEPNSTQGMGLLTLTSGAATIQSTFASTGATLTFSNVAARTAGATANFVTSGGTNGTTNNIVLTQFGGVATPTGTLLDRGIFFGGSSYATYNAGGYLEGFTGSPAADANAFISATTNYDYSTTTSTTLSTNRTANTIHYTGTGGITDLSTTVVTNNLTLNGILATGASGTLTIQRTAGSGTVVIGTSNELVIAGSQAVTISAPITGSALTYSGTNTLTLSGANSYTGATTINSGTLQAGSTTALGTNSAVTLANVAGATLNITGFDVSIGSLNGGGASGGNVQLGNNNLTVGGGGSNSVFAGNLSGATNGGLIKIGAGSLTLSGNNTYSSGQTNTGVAQTDLKEGTVIIDSTNPFGNWIVALSQTGVTGVTVQAATTARTVTNAIWLNSPNGSGAATTFSGSLSLTLSGNVMGRGGPQTVTNNITGGGTLSLTGNVYTDLGSGNQTLTFNGTGNTNISAPIANNFNNFAGFNGSIIKDGAGTLSLSGTSTYSGTTTVSAGTLLIGSNAPSASAGALGNATSNVSLGGASSASLLTNGAFTVARNIDVASGAGTTVIGGNSAHSSSFTGNIALSKAVTLQAATGGTVDFATGTWTSNNNIVNVGTSGNTGIVKLSNTLTTTGAVNVNFGTLLVSGSLSGTTSVAVNSTATLGGSGGTIGATATTVNVNAGGTLAPGASIGQLNIGTGGTNTVNFVGSGASKAILSIELNAPSSSSDLLVINGNLNLGVDDQLTLTLLNGGTATGSYTIATYTGTLTGTFDNIVGMPSSYSIDYGTGTNSSITIIAVPEPGAAVSLLGGLGLLLGVRRRRSA